MKDEVLTSNQDHNHAPMLAVESEYLIELQKLKEICSKFTMLEIKHRYEQIHSQLELKYGREIVKTHWQPWKSVKSTFVKISAKSKGSTQTIAKIVSTIVHDELAP